MSSIRSVGSGFSAAMFEDPMMAAEAVAIDAAQDDRNAARVDRRTAQQEREAHLDHAISEDRAGAYAKLASALVSAGSRIAEGVAGIAVADLKSEATRLDTEVKASEAHASRGEGFVDVGLRTDAREATRRVDLAEGVSKTISGGLAATSGALDLVAENHRISSKQAEQAADRARERAEDARERGQGAGEVASRMLNRAEDIARAQRQAEDQRIANMRG